MDAVRGACATAPARSHTGCGAAQKIEIEPHFSLPSQCSHAILVEVRASLAMLTTRQRRLTYGW